MDQQPSSKRRRVAIACTSCRRRKTRCNGVRPVCGFCAEYELPCSYEQPATDEGANSNGVQAHRMPATPTSDLSSQSEARLANIEATLIQLLQTQQRSPAGILNLPVSNYNSSTPHAVLDGVKDKSQVNNMIDGLASVPNDVSPSDLFFGSSSNVSFLRTLSAATIDTLRQWNGSYLYSYSSITDPLIPSLTRPSFQQADVDPLELPSKEHALRLLDRYFRFPAVLYPCLDEEDIRQRFSIAIENGYRGFTHSFLALVNAIFALSSYSGQFAADTPDDHSEAYIFHERAKVLSQHQKTAKASLDIVQCLLVMCMYTQGTQNPFETGELHSDAVRLALQLGLHAPSSWRNLTAKEHETRKRTWANCVMMDRVLSAAFGRPLAISHRCGRVDLDDLNGHDVSTSPPRTCDSFTATAKLYNILSHILTDIYNDNMDQHTSHSLGHTLQQSLSFEQSLQSWQENLPPSLKLTPWEDDFDLGDLDPVFEKLSTVTRLRSLNVWMLKDRSILDQMLCRHKKGHIAGVDNCRLRDLAHINVRNLRDIATEMICIIWKLSSRRGTLGAWWYSASFVMHASLVLLGCLLLQVDRISDDEDHDLSCLDDIINTLQKGRDAVQVLVKDSGRLDRIRATLEKILQTAETLVALLRQRTPDESIVAVASRGDQGNDIPQQPTSASASMQNIVSQDMMMDWQAMLDMNMDVFPILNRNGTVFNLNEFIAM